MQTPSSRIWTQVSVFISSNGNHLYDELTSVSGFGSYSFCGQLFFYKVVIIPLEPSEVLFQKPGI